MASDITRHLGTASILIVAAATLWVLVRTPVTKGVSLSEHIGREHTTFMVFAIASTVSAVCMVLFLWGWLIPQLQLPPAFQAVAALIIAGQLGVGWGRFIPDPGKWDAHSYCAYGMAFLMPLMLSFLLFANLTPSAKTLIGFAVLWMVGTLCLLFVPNIRRFYLPFQAGFMICFCMSVMAAAYL
ncbi:MAG TPA: hypothetical protein VM581_02045 [Magnetospirillaceae bacterium]|nr:hypothetical protein [Magnetospirillaceae bacterium]